MLVNGSEVAVEEGTHLQVMSLYVLLAWLLKRDCQLTYGALPLS